MHPIKQNLFYFVFSGTEPGGERKTNKS